MMGYLRVACALLFLLITVPFAAIIAFPWTFITRRVEFLWFVGMSLAKGAVWLAGVRVKTVGFERIDPKGTYIFMSNHVSDLDPPILVPLIPRRTSVLAKKEIWKVPILAQALDMASIVPVERHNRDAAIQSIQRAGEVMAQGINMTVYPEGTRSPDGRLLPFKKGPFHLAAETGVPVVPVTMLGTFEMMPKGSLACKGGTATVVFHPPIDPMKYSDREALTQAVFDAINRALPQERQ